MSVPGISRLLRGSAIYAGGTLASRLVALLLLPVFTAYLAPSEFGVLALLTALSALLVPMFSLGLGTSIGVCYFNTGDADERRAFIRSAAWLAMASALVLAAAGYVAREQLGRLVVGDASYAPHTAWALASAAAGVMATPWQLKLQFEERPGAFVLVSLAGAVVTGAASVWLVVANGMGALGPLVGTFAGQATTLVLCLAVAGEVTAFRLDPPKMRELLMHGVPMIPSFFFLFVLQQGMRWPLEWTHGLDAVGVYSVGASVGGAMALLTSAFTSAWTPFALGYGERKDEAVQELGRVALYFVAAFGFLVCLFFLFAVPLVALFAAEAYRGAVAVVGLSAAGHFFLALFSVLLPPLYFAKRVGNVAVTQLAAVAGACALAYWLIPAYGVGGAGATVALSCLLLVVIQWLALRAMRVLRISYDYGRIVGLLAVFAAVAALSFRLGYADLLTGVAQALALALATALVAGAIFVPLGAWRRA